MKKILLGLMLLSTIAAARSRYEVVRFRKIVDSTSDIKKVLEKYDDDGFIIQEIVGQDNGFYVIFYKIEGDLIGKKD